MVKRTRTTTKADSTESTVENERLFEEYTSPSSDITITLRPIAYYKIQGIGSRIEEQFRARGEPVDPPKFEVEVAGGDKQPHQHYHEVKMQVDPETGEETEVVVRSSLKTDEDRAAWDLYLNTQERMRQESIEPILNIAFTDGIEFEYPEGNEWIETQEFQGLSVPENSAKRRFHYVLTEILKTPDEQKEVVEKIMVMSISGRDPEMEAAFRALFRGQMEGLSK